jgi:hypothetical protein
MNKNWYVCENLLVDDQGEWRDAKVVSGKGVLNGS